MAVIVVRPDFMILLMCRVGLITIYVLEAANVISTLWFNARLSGELLLAVGCKSPYHVVSNLS